MVDSSFFGTHHRCHLRTRSGERITVHLPQSQEPQPGAELDLRLARGCVVVLPDA
ncbi:TOBE domain-containing protein [Ensifer psoraleae]|uniref:TOBE domain-containing protein n=1 Tax=Sinorhizobium psoraleae TaxID=520838 RepID=A0ABT4K9K3_9HYPH|nr:TOBE domain-containing protein [Sinorhizobium psoraleae]